MTPLDVLAMIRQAGGSVTVENGELQIKAPKGLLTPEHRAVLAEHKAVLISILPDAKREAIQCALEVEVPPDTARQELTEIANEEPMVIRAEIQEDELRLVCPSSEIRDKIEAGRPYLENVLALMDGNLDLADTATDAWDSAIEFPAPCPKCGSLELWQSLAGTWRCLRCDPPIKAEMWAAKAKQLRERSAKMSALLDKHRSYRYNDRSRSRIAPWIGS